MMRPGTNKSVPGLDKSNIEDNLEPLNTDRKYSRRAAAGQAPSPYAPLRFCCYCLPFGQRMVY
jgi:hypothetical protein